MKQDEILDLLDDAKAGNLDHNDTYEALRKVREYITETQRNDIFTEIVKLFVYAGADQGKDGYPADLYPNSCMHVNEIRDRIRHYQETGEILNHRKHWNYLHYKRHEEEVRADHEKHGCHRYIPSSAV